MKANTKRNIAGLWFAVLSGARPAFPAEPAAASEGGAARSLAEASLLAPRLGEGPEAAKASAGAPFAERLEPASSAEKRAGAKKVPIEYIPPGRPRLFAWGGALLGAAAGFAAAGPFGAVGGAMVGYTAGAFAGYRIYPPAMGLVAGAVAATALGLGAPGLLFGAMLGGILGLALTFLL